MNAFLRRFFQIIIFVTLSFLYFSIISFMIPFLFPHTTISFDNILGLISVIIYITIIIPLILVAIHKIEVQ